MKTIIVATDFSPVALNATAYAVKISKTLGAELLLFNVFEVIPNYNEMIIDLDIDSLKKSSEAQMVKFKRELLTQVNSDSIITTEVRIGIFRDELNTLCEHVNPYAVIMGSQGKSATEYFFMGSHAGGVMQHSLWPVITVPPDVSFSAIKKIGIAYDFEKTIDDSLIADIKLLAYDLKASIDILNSAEEDEFDANFVFLSRVIENSFKPFEVKFHFLTSHHSEEGILKFVDNNNIDLLIVMPKHHSLFQTIFHKSHTKNMVLHCHVPVLALSK